jgi:hypothetical protein
MHGPTEPAGEAVNRSSSVKNAANAKMVYTKVHWLPIDVVGKDHDGEDHEEQKDLLRSPIAKHVLSLATRDQIPR